MRREFKIVLATSAMFGLAGGMFGPIYAVFVEEIGGDLLTAGSAYALFAISTGVLMLFTAKLEDRSKHKEKFFIIANILGSIGILGYLFISKPIHLFVVQIILGISDAIGGPVYLTIISKNIDKGKITFQWGMTDATWYILGGVAALIGGYFANLYGFRFIFVIMFIVSLIGLALSLLLLKKK